MRGRCLAIDLFPPGAHFLPNPPPPRLLEEARGQAAARAGVSQEEHARLAADNRQLAAQVRCGAVRCWAGLGCPSACPGLSGACRPPATSPASAPCLSPCRRRLAQKQELAAALKKAGKLIDVLRRQKALLEAAALLQVSSRELAEALEVPAH